MYQYKATVLSVYDADTITLDIDLGCWTHIVKEKCRLLGINAPEMRGLEKPEGTKSRDWLRKKILGKDITIITTKDKTGKYGRLLVTVYFDGENINELLITEGLAERAAY